MRSTVADVADEPGWRPANAVEVTLYQALLRSDVGRYLATVASAPLYVPAVDGGSRRLVTWTRSGRTHLLAFTSPEGLGRVVGAEADTVLRLSYAALARDWPDASWWLALNPTTPIDATVPVTEVRSPSEDLVPGAPDTGGSGTGGLGTGGLGTGVGGGAGALPGVEAFAEDPAPENELEEAMAEVLAQGNVPLLLDLLVFAEVLLPTLRPVASVDLEDPYFPWAALPADDEDAVGVFTSPARLAAVLGPDVSFVRAPLISVVDAWPGPEYALRVNPGSALRARLPGPEVPALLEWARLAAEYHGVPAG